MVFRIGRGKLCLHVTHPLITLRLLGREHDEGFFPSCDLETVREHRGGHVDSGVRHRLVMLHPPVRDLGAEPRNKMELRIGRIRNKLESRIAPNLAAVHNAVREQKEVPTTQITTPANFLEESLPHISTTQQQNIIK